MSVPEDTVRIICCVYFSGMESSTELQRSLHRVLWCFLFGFAINTVDIQLLLRSSESCYLIFPALFSEDKRIVPVCHLVLFHLRRQQQNGFRWERQGLLFLPRMIFKMMWVLFPWWQLLKQAWERISLSFIDSFLIVNDSDSFSQIDWPCYFLWELSVQLNCRVLFGLFFFGHL